MKKIINSIRFYFAFLNVLINLKKLKGATFISINNYRNKSNDLANYLVNTNISVQNVKANDLSKLKSCTTETLKKVNKKLDFRFDILETALSELISSAIKNLNPDLNNRTNHSKAQTKAYYKINKAIKINKKTKEIYIFGLLQSKTIIEQGQHKENNFKPLTIAKNEIKKELNLRSEYFTTFILKNCQNIKINGNTIIIKN